MRQRIPFKFSSYEGQREDTRVLDEQEQEDIIENLRRDHTLSSQHYYKFLQGCLSFTIILYFWAFISSNPATPVHVFFPNAKKPLPNLIPYATWLELLNIIMLLNVLMHLPRDLSFPRLLHSIFNSLMSRLPIRIQEAVRSHIPFPIIWAASLCISPLLIAVFTVTDIPQILWWSLPDVVVGIVVLVRVWIMETNLDMERLEKMKYVAKGA